MSKSLLWESSIIQSSLWSGHNLPLYSYFPGSLSYILFFPRVLCVVLILLIFTCYITHLSRSGLNAIFFKKPFSISNLCCTIPLCCTIITFQPHLPPFPASYFMYSNFAYTMLFLTSMPLLMLSICPELPALNFTSLCLANSYLIQDGLRYDYFQGGFPDPYLIEFITLGTEYAYLSLCTHTLFTFYLFVPESHTRQCSKISVPYIFYFQYLVASH